MCGQELLRSKTSSQLYFSSFYGNALRNMTQSGLLQLYPIILIPILSEWISDEDLCCLDTAVCNKRERKVFLANVKKCNLVNDPEHTTRTFDDYLHWIVLRSIGLKCISIRTIMTDRQVQLLQLVLQRTKHLYYLNIHGWSHLEVIEICQRGVSVDVVTTFHQFSEGIHYSEKRIPKWISIDGHQNGFLSTARENVLMIIINASMDRVPCLRVSSWTGYGPIACLP